MLPTHAAFSLLIPKGRKTLKLTLKVFLSWAWNVCVILPLLKRLILHVWPSYPASNGAAWVTQIAYYHMLETATGFSLDHRSNADGR